MVMDFNETKELQRTPEWFANRLGKFTASRIHDLLGKGRKKDEVFSKTALSYIYEVIAEKETGRSDSYSNVAMDYGIEIEPLAIQRYETTTNTTVKEAGFVQFIPYQDVLPTFEELTGWLGGSPDGIIQDENGNNIKIIEVKCPFSSKYHIESLIKKDIPETYYFKYYAQMQLNMLVTNTQSCDFVSFDPRVKNKDKQIVIVNIKRNEEYIKTILERVKLAVDLIKQLED